MATAGETQLWDYDLSEDEIRGLQSEGRPENVVFRPSTRVLLKCGNMVYFEATANDPTHEDPVMAKLIDELDFP